MSAENPSFLHRHEFVIRRLHSFSGLVPVGAYMIVHLLTNATILDSPASFQRNVFTIHGLGSLLPLVEWVFIFFPILFHAVIGIWIISEGLPNNSAYPYTGNLRYTLQRATGVVALLFIVWHVLHMHGWFHFDAWLHYVAEPLGGHKFRPYNAASSAAAAFQQSWIVPVLYAVGILACVFHLANGLWTMGITWGVWTSPVAQRRATVACTAFGVLLAAVGLAALGGFAAVDIDEARRIEDRMYEEGVKAGLVKPYDFKRSLPREAPPGEGE